MNIRDATLDDLSAIVEIYNAAIPGRMATADTEPISVDSRLSWYRKHCTSDLPLWV
ncbi:MAG: N-acetyltransferase, partial [Cyanobacteriota bacterium]|nr:N-acetyltransferase [Cyanobacteriota bacterium]